MQASEASRLWKLGESKKDIVRECQADMRLYDNIKDYLSDEECYELATMLKEQGQDLEDKGKL